MIASCRWPLAQGSRPARGASRPRSLRLRSVNEQISERVDVDVCLLGPVAVSNGDGRVVRIGSLKQRIVLAMLALDAGHVVSTARLIDALWEQDPPPSALATLQGLVYQLRHTLGAQLIESRPPGYCLVPELVTVDVQVLTAAVGRPVVELESGLRLVRGRPLDDLGDGAEIETARRRLEELRLSALEAWCEMALSADRAGEVVVKVEHELAVQRWRESLWALLMRALYRSDRQADALQAYGRARHALVEDLGLDPGPALQRLHQQILTHDPTLSARPDWSASGLAVGDVPLPSGGNVVARRADRLEHRHTEHPPRAGRGDYRAAFAGRVGELAHLRRRLGGTLGSVSMIIGEPGIGKTRLVSELADEAEANGRTVLWGRCPDGDWASPYSPFVEAFDRYLSGLDPDDARLLLGASSDPLRSVLPIVAELMPAAATRLYSDPNEVRFEILDGFRRLLTCIAESQPVVLVLDDLHWIDGATASALSFLMPLTATVPLHIVGTYREADPDDAHPLSVALAGAHRLVTVDRVRLRGLSAGPARQVIEELGGVPVGEATVNELLSASGGNPFFLTELIRFRLEQTDGVIPDSVNDTIRQRLTKLHPSTQTMLRVAALFDGRFPLEATRLVADLDEEAALDAVDEAIAAQLIDGTADLDEFSFVHALTRVAVRSTINPSRMQRLVRRLANVLERLPSGVGTENLARIAVLYHASRALPDAHLGVGYALAAAERADAVAAHAERAELLSVALDLMGVDDPRRPRTMANLAIAQARAFRTDETIDLGLEAAEAINETEGDEAACHFLATIWSEVRLTGSWTDDESQLYRWLDRGVELGAGSQSPAFNYLSTSRHMFRINTLSEWDFDERASLLADREFVRQGRLAVGQDFFRPERLALIAAVSTCAEARDVDTQMGFTYLSEFTGDLDAIVRSATSWIDNTRRHGQVGTLVGCLVDSARALACLGQIPLARKRLDEAVELQRSIPVYIGRIFQTVLGELQVTAICDGPWDEHIARVGAIFELISSGTEREKADVLKNRPVPRFIASLALVNARRGKADRAMEMVDQLIGYLFGAAVQEQGYAHVAYCCADAIWFAGEHKWAAEIEEVIVERWMPCDFRNFGAEYRLSLARLCAVQGRVEEATAWFGKARDVYVEEGAIALLAIVDHDEAWMHTRLPGAVCDADVVAQLDRAIAQFTEIGMPGWLGRAEHLRSQMLNGHSAAQATRPTRR